MRQLSADTFTLEAEERRARFWAEVPRLAGVAAGELRDIAGHMPYLEQAAVYIDDPSQRQSAAAIHLEFRFTPEDELSVRVICLVDHRLEMRIGRAATTAEYDRVADRIRKQS